MDRGAYQMDWQVSIPERDLVEFQLALAEISPDDHLVSIPERDLVEFQPQLTAYQAYLAKFQSLKGI